jgi:hypothetical protein
MLTTRYYDTLTFNVFFSAVTGGAKRGDRSLFRHERPRSGVVVERCDGQVKHCLHSADGTVLENFDE